MVANGRNSVAVRSEFIPEKQIPVYFVIYQVEFSNRSKYLVGSLVGRNLPALIRYLSLRRDEEHHSAGAKLVSAVAHNSGRLHQSPQIVLGHLEAICRLKSYRESGWQEVVRYSALTLNDSSVTFRVVIALCSRSCQIDSAWLNRKLRPENQQIRGSLPMAHPSEHQVPVLIQHPILDLCPFRSALNTYQGRDTTTIEMRSRKSDVVGIFVVNCPGLSAWSKYSFRSCDVA